jgi:hypothetical protein
VLCGGEADVAVTDRWSIIGPFVYVARGKSLRPVSLPLSNLTSVGCPLCLTRSTKDNNHINLQKIQEFNKTRATCSSH